MGRPQKDGLDYFPLDVYMDDSIALVEADYGVEGFGIIIKLYQQIYANGYYLHVDNKRLKLISRTINVDVDLLREVIKLAVEYDIYNKKLYKKYEILTSRGIQKRYLFASLRRLSANFYKEYLLLGVNDNINSVNVNINSINVTETPVNDDSNSHTILKDIKEKNIPYGEIIEELNSICGTNYKSGTENTKKFIRARFNENFCLEDFKKVIEVKCESWKGTEQEKYLRPETLFGNKFEGYLQETGNRKKEVSAYTDMLLED